MKLDDNKYAIGPLNAAGLYVARSIEPCLTEHRYSTVRLAFWFDGKSLSHLDGRPFGAGISIEGEWHTTDNLAFAGPFTTADQVAEKCVVKSPRGQLHHGKRVGDKIVGYLLGEDWIENADMSGWTIEGTLLPIGNGDAS